MATVWNKLDGVQKYAFLGEHFPRFMDAFGPLSEALKQAFYCGIDINATNANMAVAVYGLGRLCLEDFVEILFLTEHDYGFAAIKLLRGLYERAVVSEIIVEDPATQGERFLNYCAVDMMKFRNRATSVYKGRWGVKNDADLERQFEEVKKDYKYQPCQTCHRPPQTAWTEYGLDALAESLGKQSSDRALQDLGKKLKDLYLVCAALPNSHIHASMFSIIQRLSEEQTGLLVFKQGSQLEQVDYALSQTHGLMILVLHTQNQFFELGLESVLERLWRDRAVTWPVENSRAQGEAFV